MALLDGSTQNGVLPVGSLAQGGNLSVRVAALVTPVVLLELRPLGGVEQREAMADVAGTDGVGIVDVGLTVARLALLGGDDDDGGGDDEY